MNKEFSTKLDSALSQLKKTRRPRRANKTTQERYLIDEKKILFSLGKEHHARFETKIPPHKVSCRLNGTWRFGFKITAQQHYNAFSETGIFSNEVWKSREYLSQRLYRLQIKRPKRSLYCDVSNFIAHLQHAHPQRQDISLMR